MNKLWIHTVANKRGIVGCLALTLLLLCLYLYRLGTLTPALSSHEAIVSSATYGWHGIRAQSLYLPLIIVRSIIFTLFKHHGAFVSRVPNVLFGVATILTLGAVLKIWHGTRTALFGTVLFASSAWTLHVSRYADYGVLYLWIIPTLLLLQIGLQKYYRKPLYWFGSVVLWGVLLYVPGFIWLFLLHLYWQRKAIAAGWRHWRTYWQRGLYVLLGIMWLPELIHDLTKKGQFKLWVGLPAHLPTPMHYVKQLGGVFVHCFVRGPQYPELWLGKAPILDAVTLVSCLIGLYFYIRHARSTRSKVVLSYLALSIILVSLGGAASLSLVVPLLYIFAVTGITYLLVDWLKTFPQNPIARGVGIGAVSLAILLSANYNLRSYFIAWPHASSTQSYFRSK